MMITSTYCIPKTTFIESDRHFCDWFYVIWLKNVITKLYEYLGKVKNPIKDKPKFINQSIV